MTIHKFLSKEYAEISLRYSPQNETLYCFMNPKHAPVFTKTILQELNDFHARLKIFFAANEKIKIKSVAYFSQYEEVFNYGSDMSFWSQAVKSKDTESLIEYANLSLQLVYDLYTGLNLPLITVVVSDGEMMGGGGEMLLSANLSFVSCRSKLSFPDILFDMFPGAGAYSILQNLVGEKTAHRIILSGESLEGQLLKDTGLVDNVFDSNTILERVDKELEKIKRKNNAYSGLFSMKRSMKHISFEDFKENIDTWIKMLMKMDAKNLRTVDTLSKRQRKKFSGRKVRRAHVDRRWSNQIVTNDRRKVQTRRKEH